MSGPGPGGSAPAAAASRRRGAVLIVLASLVATLLRRALLRRGPDGPSSPARPSEPPRGAARRDRESREEVPSARALWRRNGLVWLALLALLLTSFGAAYLPLGALNTVVGLLIALTKAGLVAVLFMELRRSGALMRLAGGAGLLFALVLFALTLTDFLTRLSGG